MAGEKNSALRKLFCMGKQEFCILVTGRKEALKENRNEKSHA